MIPIEQLNIDIKKDNIIEGIMKSNGLYCLVAEPKVGKSFLALQIANSLTNNKEFLGFKVNPTSVLYISTELSSFQLKERLNITSYEFSPNSFFFLEKDSNHRLCLTDDLQLELKEFSETYNGKFVIVDIMCGIDYGYELEDNAVFCSHCGTKYRHDNSLNDQPSLLVNALCFLFPVIGVFLFLVWLNTYALWAIIGILTRIVLGILFYISMIGFMFF